MSISYDKIEIIGHTGRSIQNTLFRQSESSGKLAVVFPGFGYSSKMPLLYYTIDVILRKGINVLAVDYDYSNQPDFLAASQEDKSDWLFSDVDASIKSIKELPDFKIEILVGKSLGTLAIGHLLDNNPELAASNIIWLTPLLGRQSLIDQMVKHKPASLFVIGSADQHYEIELLSRVQEATNGEVLVVPGANHSLEVPGAIAGSLKVMVDIMEKINQFLQ